LKVCADADKPGRSELKEARDALLPFTEAGPKLLR
jgi:hypothetical protein